MLTLNLLFLFLFLIPVLYTSADDEKEDEDASCTRENREGFEYPEELGPHIEGDMVNPERSGLRDEDYRWPDNSVPYVIKDTFPKSARKKILRAMKTISEKTCVEFKPKTDEDEDYVQITNDYDGCFSSVGRIGGCQELNLETPDCFRRAGTAIHELLHALGFKHEHSRTDRDKYVTILYKNIQPDRKDNFKKYNSSYITDFGIPYDYKSVMHYRATAFGLTEDSVTIVAKNGLKKLGQRKYLTELDAEKVNAMYECDEFYK